MRLTAIALLAAVLAPGPAAGQSPAPITVALTPVVPDSGVSLRWSPKGATVLLKKQLGTLVGSFALGPAGTGPVAVKLARTPGAPHFNTLWVDVNRDGRLNDAEKLSTTPTLIRGSWWSSFTAVVMIPVPAQDGRPASTRRQLPAGRSGMSKTPGSRTHRPHSAGRAAAGISVRPTSAASPRMC